MKSGAGLWRGECAAQVARQIGLTAAVVVAVVLVWENWSQVKNLLQLVLGAGGFWHSWGIFAAVGALAAYFVRVSKSAEDQAVAETAWLWGKLLACTAFIGAFFVTVLWRGEIWVPSNCISFSRYGDSCNYDWHPSRVAACVALLAFSVCAFAAPGPTDNKE